jgi:C-terminal processing protease CtpA/Prc
MTAPASATMGPVSAMTAPAWTVTLRATEGRLSGLGLAARAARRLERRNLGVNLCPVTGAITRITKGVFDNLNSAKPGSVELGDRIVEVEGKTGEANELLSPWVVDGKLTANIRVKLVRPLLIQPVVVQVQPGQPLGMDIATDGTNIIQCIDDGLVADLNKVCPNTIEVGDRILEVDGKQSDNAVEQIRAWVKQNKGKPGDLPLTVARRAFGFKQMLLRGDFKEMSEPNSALRKPSSAWRFSVMVRLRPGQSLGLDICIDNNAIANIASPGGVASLNKANPQSLRVGDRVLSVDGIPCPCMDTVEELESWFKRKLSSKGKVNYVRLTVLRPVEWAAGVAVLPPVNGTAPAEFGDEDEAEVESSGSTSTAVSRSVSELEPQVADQTQLPEAGTLPSVKELPVEVFQSAAGGVDDFRRRGSLPSLAWVQ